ncbi:MAG: glutamine synthetase [Frankiales bacterium]|nr:glutamine synthetase [Frankiales bacterium]
MDTVREMDPAHRALAEQLAASGVEFAVGGWIDVFGRSKSKVVPIDHLPNLLAGSERYTPRGISGLGEMTPNEDESVAMPDLTTLRVLPWDRRFAWMAADLLFAGDEPFVHCPRSILKRQLDRAAAAGFTMNLGIETEFYAFLPESLERTDGYLVPMARSGAMSPTPAYDLESTLDAMPFLSRMVAAMQETDFGVYSFDHEGGNGQFEFDFDYAPALEMADRLSFFRLMTRQIAKECGLLATFMPKPYTEAWGSGHHYNMSLADATTGENLMRDPGDPRGKGWSKIAYGFTAGIMRHAGALSAITTPTVNSYKRLNPRLADGSASWAPVWSAYGEQNRSCMLRLPVNRPAIENRVVDSAANTYLAAAFLLAAGLEGVQQALDPGDPVDAALTDGRSQPGTNSVRLPRTLLEAVEAFEADPLVHQVFPGGFVQEYVDMKHGEWDAFHAQVTPWERDRYLLAL